MTKILVTGSNGQLGTELRSLAVDYPGNSFIFTDINELDICDADAVNAFFNDREIDVTINCAAYNAVDKAEVEREPAMQINAGAVENLCNAANNTGTLLIHVSTDYVFGGDNHRPYHEEDGTGPLSHYAATKLAGEKKVINNAEKALILRTSWLYSSFGNNFVKTINRLSLEKRSLNVVFDQVGAPTYARDLARTIMSIIPIAQNRNGVHIYHYSNEGVCSWYDMAVAIVETNRADCRINPILTKDYPLPAKRPFYSILDKSKIKEEFGIDIPYWRDSLIECVKLIAKQ
jgi:dTDP-4-dehydrorhamnose reductase